MHLIRVSSLLACALATLPLPAQWIDAQPANLTTPLTGAAMAGRSGGQVFLFGGENTATGTLSGATWKWDAGDWYPVNGAVAPAARKEATLALDTARNRFVLFGGWTGAANGETWEFDGLTWTAVAPANTPGARWKHGMCFDSQRSRTVVYGGATGAGASAVATTWEYDGGNWTQVATVAAPGPREDHAMCFHQAIARTVLFGGLDPVNGVQAGTWLYDGSTWTQLTTAHSPSARAGAQMVYDGNRSVTILFGGADASGNLLDDTWEFDGVDWVQQPTVAPAGRDVAFANDLSRRRLVRFGGQGSGAVTWLYGAYTDGIGTGCIGSNGQFFVGASPARIGEPFYVFLNNLSSVGLGVVILSLTQVPATPLDALGMPGCVGHVTPDVMFVAVASGGGTSATWSGTWGNQLSTLGTPVYVQALSFDPGWNAASLVASNALFCLLGH